MLANSPPPQKELWVVWSRTFIDEHQAEVVPRRVFLVNFAEGRSEVEASQEQPDRDGLSSRG